MPSNVRKPSSFFTNRSPKNVPTMHLCLDEGLGSAKRVGRTPLCNIWRIFSSKTVHQAMGNFFYTILPRRGYTLVLSGLYGSSARYNWQALPILRSKCKRKDRFSVLFWSTCSDRSNNFFTIKKVFFGNYSVERSWKDLFLSVADFYEFDHWWLLTKMWPLWPFTFPCPLTHLNTRRRSNLPVTV